MWQIVISFFSIYFVLTQLCFPQINFIFSSKQSVYVRDVVHRPYSLSVAAAITFQKRYCCEKPNRAVTKYWRVDDMPTCFYKWLLSMLHCSHSEINMEAVESLSIRHDDVEWVAYI